MLTRTGSWGLTLSPILQKRSAEGCRMMPRKQRQLSEALLSLESGTDLNRAMSDAGLFSYHEKAVGVASALSSRPPSKA